MTSGAKSEGRFGKQNFVYLPIEDVYRCRVGQKLSYRFLTRVMNIVGVKPLLAAIRA